MAYNTGNSIGSTDPRDLYDNAQNLDTAMHTPETTWTDRLGNARPSWAGATGYQVLAEYAAGINVTTYNQVIHDTATGEYWRAAAGTALPYTTTGAGMPESGKFVSVGDAVLRGDLVAAGGSDLVGFQQSGAGAIVRTVQDKMREWVSVKDFGAVGDGVTDDTAAIQAAVTATANSKVFFPRGTYRISSTILLPRISVIEGVTPKADDSGSTIKNVGNGYAFQLSSANFPRCSIRNLVINSPFGLDLRAGDGDQIATCDIQSCTFISGVAADGVAIHMLNHDFSNILDCNFYGFKGYAGIVCLGAFDVVNYANNKNTTQVSIDRNIFSFNTRIGIYADGVDSIHIGRNDFGSTLYPIDLGGSVYSAALPGPTGYYKREEANPTTRPWAGGTGTFTGLGWFSNCTVTENHIEHAAVAITANGVGFEHNSGAIISYNNIFFSGAQTEKALALTGIRSASAIGNVIDVGTVNTVPVISYGSTINLLLDANAIFSRFAGTTVTQSYHEASTSYATTIIRKIDGGDADDLKHYCINRAQIDDIRTPVASNTHNSAKDVRIGQSFSVAATLALNDEITLFSYAGEKISGLIVMDVFASDSGRFATTWAVGHSGGAPVFTRLSDEGNTTLVYSLVTDTTNKLVKLKSGRSGSVNFGVSGVLFALL